MAKLADWQPPINDAKLDFAVEVVLKRFPRLVITRSPYTNGDFQELMMFPLGGVKKDLWRISNTFVAQVDVENLISEIENQARRTLSIPSPMGRGLVQPSEESWTDKWVREHGKV